MKFADYIDNARMNILLHFHGDPDHLLYPEIFKEFLIMTMH